MRAATALAVFIASSAVARASDDSHAAFWSAYSASAQRFTTRAPVHRDGVRAIVADETRKQVGEQWVNVALRIAYVESRFNPSAVGPKTRHGRAQGVMQVMPGTARALGYNPARLREPRYGAAAGVAHMRLCIAYGVRTERQMAACHVSGTAGWKRRLARGHEAYKSKYVRMVMR